MEKVYGGSHLGLARVGARIFDLKAQGHTIEGKKDADNPAIYWYQLTASPAAKKKPEVRFEMRNGMPVAVIG